jgi:hypothetical protein
MIDASFQRDERLVVFDEQLVSSDEPSGYRDERVFGCARRSGETRT